MNAKNAPIHSHPQQIRSDISASSPRSSEAPFPNVKDPVPSSKAFSIWMEEDSKDRPCAKVSGPSGSLARGIPLPAVVIFGICFCAAVWWAVAGEMRISQLERDLDIAGREMADLQQQSQADAAQAKSAFDALSKKAAAEEEQALAQIRNLQGDLKTLARISAAEKQRLQASAEAIQQNAAKMEARLREDLAGLMNSNAALEGEVTKQRDAIAADESKIAELTQKEAATDAALKDMRSQYAIVASQLSDVNVTAARLREEHIALTQVKTALESEVEKQREVNAGKELKVAELTKQTVLMDGELKTMTAKHEATSFQLDEWKVQAGKLAEMVQASEADRQAGVAEIARNKTCIDDLQRQVEAGNLSITTLETERTTLGAQIADATRKMDELALQKSELEQSTKTAAAAVSDLKDRLSETENNAAAESARLAGALAASEKAMADTRASLSQEMEASRAEVGAALLRIEKLAASFGNTTTTSKASGSHAAPLAQTGELTTSAPNSIGSSP